VILSELRAQAGDGGSSGLTDIVQTLCNCVGSLWKEKTGRVWESDEYTELKDTYELSAISRVKNIPVTGVDSVCFSPERLFLETENIDEEDYTFDPATGLFLFDIYFSKTNRGLQIIYTGGYEEGEIPEWLTGILARQVAHWYTQGKDKSWAVSSQNFQSGTTSYKSLVNNILPEFVEAAEENSF
jgi:hypothetical protein